MHLPWEKKPVIAFGAAKFNPNGKNELSAPTTFVSKTCARFFYTKMVDEYNTSKICPCCNSRIQKVIKKLEDGSIREVRGLRRCCSTVCSQVSFKNRDRQETFFDAFFPPIAQTVCLVNLIHHQSKSKRVSCFGVEISRFRSRNAT